MAHPQPWQVAHRQTAFALNLLCAEFVLWRCLQSFGNSNSTKVAMSICAEAMSMAPGVVVDCYCHLWLIYMYVYIYIYIYIYIYLYIYIYCWRYTPPSNFRSHSTRLDNFLTSRDACGSHCS